MSTLRPTTVRQNPQSLPTQSLCPANQRCLHRVSFPPTSGSPNRAPSRDSPTRHSSCPTSRPIAAAQCSLQRAERPPLLQQQLHSVLFSSSVSLFSRYYNTRRETIHPSPLFSPVVCASARMYIHTPQFSSLPDPLPALCFLVPRPLIKTTRHAHTTTTTYLLPLSQQNTTNNNNHG